LRKKTFKAATTLVILALLITIFGGQITNLAMANFLVNPIPEIHVYLTSPKNTTYKSSNITLEFTVDIPPWYLGNVYKRTEYPIHEHILYEVDDNPTILNTKIASLPGHKSSFHIPLTNLSAGSHTIEVTATALYEVSFDSQRSESTGKIHFTITQEHLTSISPIAQTTISPTPTTTQTATPAPSATATPSASPAESASPETSPNKTPLDSTVLTVIVAVAVVLVTSVVLMLVLAKRKH
jgi:hypothetical protein